MVIFSLPDLAKVGNAWPVETGVEADWLEVISSGPLLLYLYVCTPTIVSSLKSESDKYVHSLVGFKRLVLLCLVQHLVSSNPTCFI